METTLRNATLADLARVLEEQKDAKRDVVVPAATITAEDGMLRVPGMDVEITADSVDDVPGLLRPTARCDETLADKLGIPVKYLRAVREDQGLTVPDYSPLREMGVYDEGLLLDAMLNAHFRARPGNVLVRGFRGQAEPDGDGIGIGRAILSDQFASIDNIDVLYSALEAARAASPTIEVTKVDLSERAMRVFLVAPEITCLAPELTRGYRSPFRRDGQASPVVQAGIAIDNSETGGGAYQVSPRFVLLACDNGLRQKHDAVRAVHIGGRLEEGLIRWSPETQAKNLDLIAAKTHDAIATFLDVDYMRAKVAEIEGQAGVEITRPQETITVIAQKLRYSESERETLLSHFISGGQATAGGILNAVTSMAQTVGDPDRAADIETSALDALALAAVR